ncbi:MAG: SGNH/GDSL hydrolase family protein [Blautia sp.]
MTGLEGKSLYGFGDSLVRGHWLNVGMLDLVAEKHGMVFTNYAQNGATVIPGIARKLKQQDWPDIASQITQASLRQPDVICFDGMTNDISPLVLQQCFGSIASGFSGGYDTASFTGALEQICWRLREKYPDSLVIYICPHKMKARDLVCQELFQARAKEVCGKWSVPYVDVYGESGLDTCEEAMRLKYSYDKPGERTGGSGTHLNEEGYARWYAPLIEKKLLECL